MCLASLQNEMLPPRTNIEIVLDCCKCNSALYDVVDSGAATLHTTMVAVPALGWPREKERERGGQVKV